jgi:FAD/FMN-containing dehydrogenase
MKHLQAAAVLHPTFVHEIAELIQAMAFSFAANLTVAAKGVGHSTNGQSQVCPGFFFCWIQLIIIVNSLSRLN